MDSNELENQAQESNIELTPDSITYLSETRKWAKFLAILGFVSMGFLVIFGFFFGTFFSELSGQETELPFPSFFIGFFYLIMAVLYFFPILYLYQFSSLIKKALNYRSKDQLSLAFKSLKSHYRFIGIMTIVIFGFYILILLVAMIVGFSSFLWHDINTNV
jgi:MFS family permease